MDDQFLTKEYPLSREYPPTSVEYPSTKQYEKHQFEAKPLLPQKEGLSHDTAPKFNFDVKMKVKSENKFLKILKIIFVNHYEIKLISLGTAVAIWLIIAGLG